ncbi:hypothetical protein Leryth_018459 [Lithospermum erythrorhizon]|nr:hypothetical protein Leryth_018459 [Lithospermum erythrorhizon]
MTMKIILMYSRTKITSNDQLSGKRRLGMTESGRRRLRFCMEDFIMLLLVMNL